MKTLQAIFLILFGVQSLSALALNVGDKAPDFTVKDRDGNQISLRALQGKVVLLDFWASWCGPCRAASKDLVKLYEKYHPKGFEVFSVSLDSKKETWLKAIEKDHLYWPYHGSDFKEWESVPAQLYSINAIPTGFLIDENGIIVEKSHEVADIEVKLQEIFYRDAIPFPLTTAEKIIFPDKLKYEIVDANGKSLLKGKDETVDVTGLAEGKYTLAYADTTISFTKVLAKSDTVSYKFNLQSKSLDFSKNTFYEVYNSRGNVLKSGQGIHADLKDLVPNNYYINVDGRVKQFVRPAGN